jgi:hypothetical protein
MHGVALKLSSEFICPPATAVLRMRDWYALVTLARRWLFCLFFFFFFSFFLALWRDTSKELVFNNSPFLLNDIAFSFFLFLHI